jgi:predicted SprT family Zn-dependent metalloprotease
MTTTTGGALGAAPSGAMDVLAVALAEQGRARAIIADLGPCRIVLSRMTTSFGVFSVEPESGDMEIRISKHISTVEQVRETARHELAHQAAWERYADVGHGAYWQTFASYLGCEPIACARVPMFSDVAIVARYRVTCSACGWAVVRQRRSKLVAKPWRFGCARCGGKLVVASIA